MRKIPDILAALPCAAGASAPHPWYPPDPENTVVIDTSKGRIIVEMRPDFAPRAGARVQLLSREQVYVCDVPTRTRSRP